MELKNDPGGTLKMSDTDAASGDPKARLLLQLKEVAATLKAGSGNHMSLVDIPSHNPIELNHWLSMEGLYRFCAFRTVENQNVNDDKDSTRDEQFTMNDAIRVAGEVRIMWPNIQDVTAERVYALKKMVDADIEADLEASRDKLEHFLIDVIMSEGMYRIAEAEREKPIDGLSDTEKQDLIRNVVGTAKRVKRITAHGTASSLATEPATNRRVNASLIVQPLEAIREILRDVVENTNAMVKEVKDFPATPAFEALTPAELQERFANCATIKDSKPIFSELLRRQVLTLNDCYEKYSLKPIGDLVKILDPLELDKAPGPDGLSDASRKSGDSEMDRTSDE